MATSLQVPLALSSCSSKRRMRYNSVSCRINSSSAAKIPMPPLNPNDPFLSKLASVATAAPDSLLSDSSTDSVTFPFIHLLHSPKHRSSPRLMSAPAHVEGSGSYGGGGRGRSRPPDLPSLLLDERIVYIGMPLVPAVTELVIAQLLYLQWDDPKKPVYLYINSTGTTRADGETVALESEGFAIYDSLMHLKVDIYTLNLGAALGQACLLLAAGKKGGRYTLPGATALVQEPNLPSTGLMPASDILIRTREHIRSRDMVARLLAMHTGNSVKTVMEQMKMGTPMNYERAKEFGVVDKLLVGKKDPLKGTDSLKKKIH